MLLIGAGDMIDLAATHFAAKAPKSITVANRTLERGAQLAARFSADAITLTELPERLAQFDIIVTSTASSLPILGKGMLERAIKARRHAPMFIVDLAVPRDVEPEAAELDDVFLYTVDDLSNIIKDNLQIRVEAVREAEAMIAEQAAKLSALARRPHGGADDRGAAGTSRSACALPSSSAPAVCSPAVRRRSRCSSSSRAGSPTSSCTRRRRRSTAPARPSAPSCSRCCTTSTSCPTSLS